jgi:hypothetical protein
MGKMVISSYMIRLFYHNDIGEKVMGKVVISSYIIRLFYHTDIGEKLMGGKW